MPIIAGQITGSSLSGSLDYTFLSTIPSGIVSGAAQVKTLLPDGTVSSSGQVDYNALANLPLGVVTSSAQINSDEISGLRLKPAVITSSLQVLGVVTSGSVTAILPANTVSSSGQVATFLPANTVSSSVQVTNFLPADTVSSSAQITLAGVQGTTFAAQDFTFPQAVTVDGTLTAKTTPALAGIPSSSEQVKPLLPGGTVTSSAQYPGWVTASSQIDITSTTGYSTFSSSLATVDANQQTELNALKAATSSYAINSTIQGQLAGVVSSSTQVKPLLPGGTVTSSATGTTQATISLNGTEVSIAGLSAASSPTFNTVTANLTGTATNANNIAIAADSTDADRFVAFVNSTTGNNAVQVDNNNGLLFNPSTNKLTVSGLASVGSLTSSLGMHGTASWATNALSANSATSATTATNANNVAVTAASDNATYYVTFTDNTSGNRAISTDVNSLSYNPSTNTLTVGTVSGNITGNLTGTASLATNALTANLVSSSAQVVAGVASQTIAPTTVNATTINATAVTASGLTANQAVFTNADDGLVSNAITGTGNVVMSASPTLTGTLTAANITANGTLLLQGIYSSSTQVDYNNIQNKLSGVISSSTQFNALTGTSATSASISSTTANATHYVMFADGAGAAKNLLVDSNNLTYNPSTDTLSVSNITVNGTSTLQGIPSSSAQIKVLLPDGTVSSSAFTSPSQGTLRLTLNGTALSDVDSGLQTSDQVTFAGVTSSLFGTSSWATNATNATNITTTQESTTDANRYVVFVDALSGNQGIKADGSLLYNSLNNGLTLTGGSVTASGGFLGPLIGTASWAQNVAGTIANATNATNATNVAISTAADSATYYVTFTDNTTGNRPTYTDANSLSYNPGTNVLTVGTVTGNVTGDLTGTASLATNVLTANVVSSSAQTKAFLPGGTVSSSGVGTAQGNIALNGVDTPVAGLTAVSNPQFAGLTVIGTPALGGIPSSSAQIKVLLPADTISSSTQVNAILDADGVFSSSAQVQLASVTGTTFAASDYTFPNNLTVGGTLKAEQFITEYVSASIIYESGSTKFGDTTDDVMSVTGSIRVLGGSISGSMVGMFSSSAQVDYNSIQNKLSGVVSSSAQFRTLSDPFTGSFTGSFTGDGSGLTGVATATNATNTTNISVLESGTWAEDGYVLFVNGITGNRRALVDSAGITYNPSTNTLTTINFAGTASRASSASIADALATGARGNLTGDGTKVSFTGGTAAVVGGNVSVTVGGGIISSSATGTTQGTISLNGIEVGAAGLSAASSPTFNTPTFTGLTVTGTPALGGIPSSSAQIKVLLPGGTVTSSAQYPGWVTSSGQIDITATSGYSVFSSSLASVDQNQQTEINALKAATSSYAINSTIQGQLAGVVSSSAQVKPLLPGGTVTSSAAGSAQGTIAINGADVNITTLQTTSSPTFAALTITNAVSATAVTASGLTANQAVFTNASDGLVSNAITGTGNVVMSASPTLTGTVTAANITANGTLLLQGMISGSSLSSTGQGNVRLTTNGVATDVGITNLATDGRPLFSGSQFSGIVSGSGINYRFVLPVGTNYYAT